jgi:hypothetical protein
MWNIILPALTKFAVKKFAITGTKAMILNTAAQVAGAKITQDAAEKRAKSEAASRQANFYTNLRNSAQAAGFNPLSVLNSGSVGAFAAAGEPVMQYGPLSSLNFNDMMNAAEMHNQDMRESEARITNIKSNIELDRQRVALEHARLQNDIDVDRAYLDMASDKHEHEVQNTMSQTNLNAATEYLTTLQAERAQAELTNYRKNNGIEYKTIPLQAKYFDKVSGRWFWGLNPEAFEIGVSEAIAGAGLQAGYDINTNAFPKIGAGLRYIGEMTNVGKLSPGNWLSMQMMRAMQ